ncbi:MAG: hypothetical protein P1U64_05260 [Alcanivoracaceae bacterium]|nr:hypothetical protein [Alcanivoracaceae bacterium]
MFQILVALAVLFAAITALVASHRVGHRLFVRVSASIAVLALVGLAAMVFQLVRPPALAAPDSVSVAVRAAHRVEVGYRLELVASNHGEANTRQMVFDVQLLGCMPPLEDGACEEWGNNRVDMPMHLPPGGSYPFNRILPYPPLPDGLEPVWQVTVEQVQVYR